MGEYEEIFQIGTPSGLVYQKRKISTTGVSVGIRIKLPKEYSSYAISKYEDIENICICIFVYDICFDRKVSLKSWEHFTELTNAMRT